MRLHDQDNAHVISIHGAKEFANELLVYDKMNGRAFHSEN